MLRPRFYCLQTLTCGLTPLCDVWGEPLLHPNIKMLLPPLSSMPLKSVIDIRLVVPSSFVDQFFRGRTSLTYLLRLHVRTNSVYASITHCVHDYGARIRRCSRSGDSRAPASAYHEPRHAVSRATILPTTFTRPHFNPTSSPHLHRRLSETPISEPRSPHSNDCKGDLPCIHSACPQCGARQNNQLVKGELASMKTELEKKRHQLFDADAELEAKDQTMTLLCQPKT